MLKASDIMTSSVITISSDASVADLAKMLTNNTISGVPVMNEKEEIVAIVTESDLIDQSKKLHIPTVITILDSVFYLENPDKMENEMKKMAGTKVADICSGPPRSVHPDTPLDEIATIMSEKNVHTLPVMDGNRLAGIIGKKDIIKTLTR